MPDVPAPDMPPDVADRLVSAVRAARVGGAFWEPPVARRGRTTIVRARAPAEVDALKREIGTGDVPLWLLPARAARDPATAGLEPGSVAFGEADPWSVLEAGVTLLAHGDDEWVALAHLAGCPVRVLSPGRWGDPGLGADAGRARAVQALLRPRYADPFTGQPADVLETVAQLGHWRRILLANRDVAAACGMAWWKRREIARFLWAPGARLRFFRSEARALAHAARHGAAVAVWPSRVSPGAVRRAGELGVPLIRVEDGFVRSVGLGSDLVPPSSVVADRSGIHYDPGRPSDLEALLAGADFPPALLARARRLRETVLAAGISKYGGERHHAFPPRAAGRRLVLVPGQVEDDMSGRLGGGGLGNMALLRRARALEPDAEIWFRPHPDVDAGHRRGAVRDADALEAADRVVRGGGMAGLLTLVDAVHVLTSLTGFEALMRGREVTCHGTPFYAGWQLTQDLAPVPAWRGRALSLDQLVAGVLILYPRYLDPVTGLPCEPELLIARVAAGAAVNRLGSVTRVRRWQGRLMRMMASA
jgi:capsular polysaccharide export protein